VCALGEVAGRHPHPAACLVERPRCSGRRALCLGVAMTTLAQCARPQSTRLKRAPLSRTPRLRSCPFGRGLVVRVIVMNPKKPNSAIRHVAKVKMYKKPRVTARMPGSGFGVVKFNRVLVRGGRANDLPGVGYSLVRGVYDFSPRFGKKRSRSYYGVPRPESRVKHVRRKTRRKQL
jgi:small subunit ribosomal protein S12